MNVWMVLYAMVSSVGALETESVDVRARSLEDYITEALEHNIDLQAWRAVVLSKQAGVSASGYLPEPTISAGAFALPIETKVGPQRMKLGVQQRLPWFGTREINREVSSSILEQAQWALVEQENNLVLELTSLWFPMVELRQEIDVLNRHTTILETVEQVVQRRLESGQGTLSDMIRADIQRQDLVVKVDLATQELALLQQQFNLLCNADLNRMLNIPTDFDVVERDFVKQDEGQDEGQDDEGQDDEGQDVGSLETGVHQNPSVQRIQSQQSQIDGERRLAETLFHPTFTVGLEYVVVGQAENGVNGRDAVVPMVGVQLPIHREKYRAVVSEKQYLQQAVRLQQEATVQRLSSKWKAVEFELCRTEQELNLLDAQQQKTERSLDLMMRRYSTDGADFEGLLVLERQLLAYEMEKISVQRRQQLALAKQDHLQGRGGPGERNEK